MRWLEYAIPGIGQIRQDRYLKGLALFALFLFCLNGALVIPLIFGRSLQFLRALFIIAAGITWLTSFREIRTIPKRPADSSGSGEPPMP